MLNKSSFIKKLRFYKVYNIWAWLYQLHRQSVNGGFRETCQFHRQFLYCWDLPKCITLWCNGVLFGIYLCFLVFSGVFTTTKLYIFLVKNCTFWNIWVLFSTMKWVFLYTQTNTLRWKWIFYCTNLKYLLQLGFFAQTGSFLEVFFYFEVQINTLWNKLVCVCLTE